MQQSTREERAAEVPLEWSAEYGQGMHVRKQREAEEGASQRDQKK